MPKVVIIILNWNGRNDTVECLESVFRLDYPDYEVLVVDNSSSDDSVGTIRRKFPHAVVIENSENLGFAGGNNIGMRHAMQHRADYVWLLNNDTIVEAESLAKMVSDAEQSPEIGMVSPVVYFYDNPEKVQFMGAYMDTARFSVTAVIDPKELEIRRVQRNLFLWGTALLVKRSVIETIGYLSEKYFAYCEDRDYSMRVLSAKFRNIISLDARILHKGSKSTGRHSTIQVFLGTRNQYFVWNDNTRGLRRVLLPGYYIGMVIDYANLLTEEGNKEAFNACLNGFWAAVRGKGGRHDSTIVIPSWLRKIFCFCVSCYPHFWVRLFRLDAPGIVRAVLAKAQVRAN